MFTCLRLLFIVVTWSVVGLVLIVRCRTRSRYFVGAAHPLDILHVAGDDDLALSIVLVSCVVDYEECNFVWNSLDALDHLRRRASARAFYSGCFLLACSKTTSMCPALESIVAPQQVTLLYPELVRRTATGDRSFPTAAASIWNAPPGDITATN